MPKELKGDLNGQGLRVAVVVARFNEVVTRQLLSGAVETNGRFRVRRVPIAWGSNQHRCPHSSTPPAAHAVSS